jgi:hypothetical protein
MTSTSGRPRDPAAARPRRAPASRAGGEDDPGWSRRRPREGGGAGFDGYGAGADPATERELAEARWGNQSILARLPGLPSWAAILIALVLTALGVVVDLQRINQLGLVFKGAYAVGCVIAVCVVRRRGLFGPMVEPPLLLAVAVPGVVLASGGATAGGGGGLTAKALAIGTPLINGFPTMGITTGVTLLLGIVRLIAQRKPAILKRGADTDLDAEAAPPAGGPRAGRERGRRAAATRSGSGQGAMLSPDGPGLAGFDPEAGRAAFGPPSFGIPGGGLSDDGIPGGGLGGAGAAAGLGGRPGPDGGPGPDGDPPRRRDGAGRGYGPPGGGRIAGPGRAGGAGRAAGAARAADAAGAGANATGLPGAGPAGGRPPARRPRRPPGADPRVPGADPGAPGRPMGGTGSRRVPGRPARRPPRADGGPLPPDATGKTGMMPPGPDGRRGRAPGRPAGPRGGDPRVGDPRTGGFRPDEPPSVPGPPSAGEVRRRPPARPDLFTDPNERGRPDA